MSVLGIIKCSGFEFEAYGQWACAPDTGWSN